MNNQDLGKVFTLLNNERDIQEHHTFLTQALYALSQSFAKEEDAVASALMHAIAENLLPSDCYPLIKTWAVTLGFPWDETKDAFNSMEHTPDPAYHDLH